MWDIFRQLRELYVLLKVNVISLYLEAQLIKYLKLKSNGSENGCRRTLHSICIGRSSGYRASENTENKTFQATYFSKQHHLSSLASHALF